MAAVSTSSGTSGRFSEIGFDFPALWCDWNMLWKIGRTRSFFSPQPTHYIILGYQFRLDNRAAVARTAFGATLLAPALSRTYALRYENSSYVPDLDGVAMGNPGFPPGLWVSLRIPISCSASWSAGASGCSCPVAPS